MSAVLRVQFYNPKHDSEGLINKMVAMADPPFCHCELHLPDNMACSIFMHSEIHFKHRLFTNPAYEAVKIICTIEQLDALYLTIQDFMQQKLRFSTSAMVGSYYGLNLCPENHTFCSKLVADLLQAVGIIAENVDCNVLSPSKLHRLLVELPTYIPVMPAAQPEISLEHCTIDWSPETELRPGSLSFARRA